MNTESKQRAEKEITEFTYNFPNVDPDDVPQSVWEEVKTGVSLSDAYGKYEKSAAEKTLSADKVNRRNELNSSGAVKGEPKRAVYTAAEVSAMSAKQIKENYEDILYSMQSKGFYA